MVLAVVFILQGLSLFLLWQQLGPTFLRKPFPIMVIMATLYHGVSEALMLNGGIRADNPYRAETPAVDIQTGALLISLAIFLSTVAYLLVSRKTLKVMPDPAPAVEAMQIFSWKVLAALLLPLAAVTYAGQGYASGEILDSRTQTQTVTLAVTLFVIVFVMTTFTFIYKHPRLFIPAIAAQSALMAAAGQRLEVLIGAIAVIVMLAFVGRPVSRKSLIWVAVIGGFFVLSITNIREASGRELFHSDSGLSARVDQLGSAFKSPSDDGQVHRSLLSQFAERFDSNEWAGTVISGMHDRPPMGMGEIPESLRIAVPSRLDPTKLSTWKPAKEKQRDYYGKDHSDHLPGHYGLWLGLTGTSFYLPVMVIFGVLWALLEGWIMSRVTAARIIWFGLLTLGALYYERGIPDIVLLLRNAVPLGVIACLLEGVMTRRREVGSGRFQGEDAKVWSV